MANNKITDLIKNYDNGVRPELTKKNIKEFPSNQKDFLKPDKVFIAKRFAPEPITMPTFKDTNKSNTYLDYVVKDIFRIVELSIGNGFLTSHLVKRLFVKNYNIFANDRLFIPTSLFTKHINYFLDLGLGLNFVSKALNIGEFKPFLNNDIISFIKGEKKKWSNADKEFAEKKLLIDSVLSNKKIDLDFLKEDLKLKEKMANDLNIAVQSIIGYYKYNKLINKGAVADFELEKLFRAYSLDLSTFSFLKINTLLGAASLDFSSDFGAKNFLLEEKPGRFIFKKEKLYDEKDIKNKYETEFLDKKIFEDYLKINSIFSDSKNERLYYYTKDSEIGDTYLNDLSKKIKEIVSNIDNYNKKLIENLNKEPKLKKFDDIETEKLSDKIKKELNNLKEFYNNENNKYEFKKIIKNIINKEFVIKNIDLNKLNENNLQKTLDNLIEVYYSFDENKTKNGFIYDNFMFIIGDIVKKNSILEIKLAQFPAFNINFSDSYSSNYNEHNFIGKPYSLFDYNSFSRDLNIDFIIYSFNFIELIKNIEKLKFLSTLVVPNYIEADINNLYLINPSLAFIRLGDYIKNKIMIVNNVNISPDLEAGFEDILGVQFPKMFKISLSLRPIYYKANVSKQNVNFIG